MLRNRPLYSLLLTTAAVACSEADQSTAPAALNPELAAISAPGRATYLFRNGTGQTVNRLVIKLVDTVDKVPLATFHNTISGKSVKLGGFSLGPKREASVTIRLKHRATEIVSWYWATADGAIVGGTRGGCRASDGCEQVGSGNLFKVATPRIQILAHQDAEWCYFFRMPANGPITIRQLVSRMPPRLLRMSLVFTDRELHPPGTTAANGCEAFMAGRTDVTVQWVYTAYTSDAGLAFPGDDGTGKPIGLVVPPSRFAYLYLLFSNPTEAPVTPQGELQAVLYGQGVSVTPTASFITWNNSINIPPGASVSSTMTCTVPPGAKLLWMSTYAGKQNVHASIFSGAATVFESSNPANPGSVEWSAPGFLTFPDGKVTQKFDYVNSTGNTLRSGGSYNTDEAGVILSYFFPATVSKNCFDGLGPF